MSWIWRRRCGAGRARPSEVRAQLPRGWRADIQTKRRGTGHAVLLALRKLPRAASSVLILYGDQPLVTRKTLHSLIETHQAGGAACTILTAVVADPRAYGR